MIPVGELCINVLPTSRANELVALENLRRFVVFINAYLVFDTICLFKHAIEIVLNSEEEAPKKISENFYLFDMPLPISRIKRIYFTNEEQKVSTNFNITSGSAFIPESLLSVSKEESIDTKELENVEYKSSEKKWSDYLKKYEWFYDSFYPCFNGIRVLTP